MRQSFVVAKLDQATARSINISIFLMKLSAVCRVTAEEKREIYSEQSKLENKNTLSGITSDMTAS
jgi:hypothetical protein